MVLSFFSEIITCKGNFSSQKFPNNHGQAEDITLLIILLALSRIQLEWAQMLLSAIGQMGGYIIKLLEFL